MSGDGRRNHVEAAILAALPATTKTLCQRVGLSDVRIAVHLERLRSARRIHVAGWDGLEHRGRSARVWGAGDKPDAPSPAPTPKALSSRRHRARQRGEVVPDVPRKTGRPPKSATQPTGREWILRQLGDEPIPVNQLRKGNRTDQGLRMLLHRMVVEHLIAASLQPSIAGQLLAVRKGAPQTPEEWDRVERSKDCLARLRERPKSRDDMLAMIWATAGMRRAA